jgi:shikimate dehydrogenase
MKKYLVVGNPIDHSLSPKLHNYWMKNNNIDGIYDRKKVDEADLKQLILKIKIGELSGINVTVPHKKSIITYLDELSPEAKITKSVNTIFCINNKVIGHNTDIEGFKKSIQNINFNLKNKKALILGAGGVVSSIIAGLNDLKISKITVTNRTKSKAEDLKNLFDNLEIIEWGGISDFDIIINATSIGLNKNDKLDLSLSSIGKNKLFYDVIYNPKQTKFLEDAKNTGNITENGMMMFIFQALASFKIWHGITPEINNDVIKYLNYD